MVVSRKSELAKSTAENQVGIDILYKKISRSRKRKGALLTTYKNKTKILDI